MALLERMLSGIRHTQPHLSRLLTSLSTSLQINHPLAVESTSDKGLAIRSLGSSAWDEPLFMVAAQKCLTSFEWSGASIQRNLSYDIVVTEAAKANFRGERVEKMSQLFKVATQLLVQYNDPQLKLHEYARFLMNQEIRTGPFSLQPTQIDAISSSTLQGAVIGTRVNFQAMAIMLHEKFPGIDMVELLHAVTVAQRRLVDLRVSILCPLVDILPHSPQPNCFLDGLHLTHLQESFVAVRPLRKIQAGETLSISKGNLGNIDLWFEQGYVLPGNEHSYSMQRVLYDDDLEWLGKAYEFKQRMLTIAEGLKDFIKLYRNSIDSKSMALLRIFFLDEDDFKRNPKIAGYKLQHFEQAVNPDNQRRVLEFIWRQLDRQEPSAPSTLPDVCIIEAEDQEIYQATLKRLKQQLGK